MVLPHAFCRTGRTASIEGADRQVRVVLASRADPRGPEPRVQGPRAWGQASRPGSSGVRAGRYGCHTAGHFTGWGTGARSVPQPSGLRSWVLYA